MSKIVNGKEYLTYDEIATEYGYNRSYVPSMVSNGVFPSVKFERDVKKYVSRDHLEAYRHRKDKLTSNLSATTINQFMPQQEGYPQQVGVPLGSGMPHIHLDGTAIKQLGEYEQMLRVNTLSSGETIFQSALADETDSKDTGNDLNLAQAIAILLGLILLLYIFPLKKDEKNEQASRKAEQELKDMGLKKEELIENKQKSLVTLQAHPRNARHMQKILKEVDALAVA